MLHVLRVIGHHLATRPATVRLPATVPSPAGFRGPVHHNATRCVGCGLCSYVCVSDAITVRQGESDCTWSYDPGRCAFCARCVERCPAQALAMTATPLAAYDHPGQHEISHQVVFPWCPDCGAPTRPATEPFVRRAFPGLGEVPWELLRRCERCRRKQLQRGMLADPSEPTKEQAP
jgi:ech hydrogenase subunit F